MADKIAIQFTQPELQAVVYALEAQPFRDVATLLKNIQEQFYAEMTRRKEAAEKPNAQPDSAQ